MKNKIIVSIKKKIMAELSNRNLSIYELAKQVDLSEPCIRNWFNNKNYVPSLNSLSKVCDFLHISLSSMFLSDDEMFIPINKEDQQMFKDWERLTDKQKEAVRIHINSYLSK